ncbi:DnaD domain protein [Natroniella acetigena]|uniref:DnaD domain-containing protein n=1 Tax=Natroniella acetigena TaxID=52004 RepID=UPI002009F418|nr:DnaD domain protein [Natroniella acetigena]MCK8827131.1 DnaD domain protein [Natroniella acetigena]
MNISNLGEPSIICKAIVEEKKSLVYKPALNEITSSVLSSILLQQIMYWAEKSDNKFFKFMSPCKHEKYKKGDSWQEELGFSKYELRTAFKNIAFKLGKSKNKIKKKDAFVIYYTDSKRLTWYSINWNVLNKAINSIYSENLDSRNTKENVNSKDTKENLSTENTILTEITTEITTENTYKEEGKGLAQFYEKALGRTINSYQLDLLVSYLNDGLSLEVVVLAIKKASVNNIYRFSYIKELLDDWLAQGLMTIKQVKGYLNQRKGKAKKKKNENDLPQNIQNALSLVEECELAEELGGEVDD